MIPRYQRIVYWCLVAGSLLLAILLVRGCERNRERIASMRDQSPIPAPTDTPSEQVPVALANDADGSITLDQVTLPLPAEPSLRARLLLERVLADDAQPASNHPLPAGPAVIDVFLVALPLVTPGSQGAPTSTSPVGLSGSFPAGEVPQGDRQSPPLHSPYGEYHAPGSQLAVVNLTKAFADAHPSGIETEDLTLRQMIATLHAIQPQVEEVRFLVDGQTRDTLNGHADLTRPYSVVDPSRLIHVLSPDGNPL